MRKKIICLFVTAVIMTTSATFGAVKAGTFAVTPLIGGYSYMDDPSGDTPLLLGGRAGYNFTKSIAVEAIYDYVTDADLLNADSFTMHRFGGQLLYHFLPDNSFVPYLAAGYSGIDFKGDALDSNKRGAFDYGVGAKYFIADDVALRGDVRHILYTYNSENMSNIEFTLGAYFQFGDSKPAAKPVSTVQATVVTSELPKTVKAEAAVSPVSSVPSVDSDLDGVLDKDDKCPKTPTGTAVDKKGCPAEVAKSICNKPSATIILFDTNKAVIKPEYYLELNKLGNFLTEFPNSKGKIEGHTDTDGSKKYNMKLSKNRAESVRGYLINKFDINGNRVMTKGYGYERPVASNKTKNGKAKNRRVEAIFSCE